MTSPSRRPSIRRAILSRQWRLLRLLGSERGLSARELAARLHVSRPTITRDLATLRDEVGIAIARRRVNGEVRHVLQGAPLEVAATPAERAAIRLARHALRHLAGTGAVRELEALAGEGSSSRLKVATPPHAHVDPKLLSQLERAMERGRRVRLKGRVARYGGEIREYELDPLTIRLSGADVYLDGWSPERGEVRTFKVARLEEVEILSVPADDHSALELDTLFAGALKTWSSDPIEVRVRLAKEVAWAVAEYPLSREQLLVHEPQGSVVVQASVAGLVEVGRWVLSWGRHAEALSPRALRERMAEELRDAAARYDTSATVEEGDDAVAHQVGSRIVNRPGSERHALSTSLESRSVRTTQVRERGAIDLTSASPASERAEES